MLDQLVRQSIEFPNGGLRLLQPRESAELPDSGGVEWAPIAPYWSVLWRSGVALARLIDRMSLHGRRVVELGCGLAAPSIVAARAGAAVIATDSDPEALTLAARNARENGVQLEPALVEWEEPDELVRRAPFDLVLAADVLYDRASVPSLLALLPRLAPEVWLADPGRPAADRFFAEATRQWWVTASESDGVVRIHRLKRVPAGP